MSKVKTRPRCGTAAIRCGLLTRSSLRPRWSYAALCLQPRLLSFFFPPTTGLLGLHVKKASESRTRKSSR